MIAEQLGLRGEVEAAGSLVETALARCDLTGEAWIVPELLRVKAGLLSRVPGHDDGASVALARAQALAREQNALAWQLRIAGGTDQTIG